MSLTIEEMRANIGRTAIIENCVDWHSSWSKEAVIIGVEEVVAVYLPINSNNNCDYTAAYIVRSPAASSWYVHPDCVILEQLKPFNYKKLYTTTCPTCHSPARKIKSGIFCSLSKCSVAKKMSVKLKLNTKVNRGNTADDPIALKCGCGRLAINMYRRHPEHIASKSGAIKCSVCGLTPYDFIDGKWYSIITETGHLYTYCCNVEGWISI